jgi:hypothetical protein
VLPRIVFVLGKGGVGRSTVSTALGLMLVERGERVLVLEWTVAEPIAPWFGLAPAAGIQPVEVAPGLSVTNYHLDDALRAYFVDHLRVGLFYRHVVNGPHMRRLIEAAPGIAELLFLGQLWWLTTLAEQEAGLRFDRIIVDAPATGHGASLLDLPSTLAGMGASGLLGGEIDRVVTMMRDPAWTGALVVSLPEDLAMEETLDLVPRATADLGRPPIAAFVNRSVARLGIEGASPPWLVSLEARLSAPAREGLATVHAELRSRARCEVELRAALEGKSQLGTFSLDEQLVALGTSAPRDVVYALAPALRAYLGGA